jgi:hypothetical protein
VTLSASRHCEQSEATRTLAITVELSVTILYTRGAQPGKAKLIDAIQYRQSSAEAGH